MTARSACVRCVLLVMIGLGVSLVPAIAVAQAQTVTYQPYIQPGDSAALGAHDQMIVAWQTNEHIPNPTAFTVDYGRTSACGTHAAVSGRVVDNYLSADHALPVPPAASGPRVNYVA